MGKRLMLAFLLLILPLFNGCAAKVMAGVESCSFSSRKNQLQDTFSGCGWSGKVVWEEGYIQVTTQGVGDPEKYGSLAQAEIMALKAARCLGYARLLEVLRGVRMDSNCSFGYYLENHTRLRARVEGVVKGAKLVTERVFIDKDRFVTGEVVLRLALNKPVKAGAGTYFKPHVSTDEKAVAEPDQESVVRKEQANTGLIVVARGIGALPALFPCVVEAGTGREIFGPDIIDRYYAIEKGVVGYAASLEKALLLKRAGDNPLVVRAIQAKGQNRARLVITREQAASVLAADNRGAFLKKCNVVIVIN
ncbi:hypothetical protein [Dethiosulfatarculus sandiegensis]|uniref:Lipoprotein n=1 Tax=Dethiosulfatarculus sandiegensis TaxID=1429043 RepID=A0A0D2HKM7_9BACT|nr:hypothetical protein [Dethiosulfatarculus sandiegensis]KIX11213.1 hypothetical protein X474_25455 [Dethiosulfatarculus sandiegensis]